MKFNESISNFNDWISNKVKETNLYIENTKNEINEKIEMYKASDEYEEDLDEMLKEISCLHYKDKKFNHIHDRKERIGLKDSQIKKKSLIAVGESAIALGISVASTVPEPSSVVCAAGIGAGTGAVLISRSAIKILYKRSLNGYEDKSFSPE
jgi:hypothetical protein